MRTPLLIHCASALLALSLSGCAGTIAQMNDCRAGDWTVIGSRDGADALAPRYEERRSFCADVDGAKEVPEAAANYQLGWAQGNAQFWSLRGSEDGRKGLPLSNYSAQLGAHKVVSNRTPPNQGAYAQGWERGNADYWRDIGGQDGKAGRPAGEEARRAASGQQIGFNAASYQQGWRDGNYAYWGALGYQDAHDGVAERALQDHVKRAQAGGVLVREDAYRQAWNKEITEYWRRLGWSDATDGRDKYNRRADAKARGLPFAEAEYQQQWEARLVQYWRDAGTADGAGKPNLLAERLANLVRDKVFQIAQTRELYNQAWLARNARYCAPDNAFEMGRSGAPMATQVCAAEQQVRRAWVSGQDYEELARKLARTSDDIAVLHQRHGDAVRKLEHLDAEIKKEQEDKNRVSNADTADKERKREQERKALHETIEHAGKRLHELREWEYRYDQQMRQIKRDIYRN